MNYYDGYSNRLLNDAMEVKRDLNLAAETNSGSEEDLALFSILSPSIELPNTSSMSMPASNICS